MGTSLIRLFAVFLTAVALFVSPAIVAQTPRTADFVLESGAGVENRIAGSDVRHSYRVKVTAGYFYRIEVFQTDFDLKIFVNDASGAPVAAFDDEPRRGFAEIADFVADADGEFKVVIVSDSKADSGPYKIRIAVARDATESERKILSARQILGEAVDLGAKNRFDQAVAKAREAKSLLSGVADGGVSLKVLARERLGSLLIDKGEYKAALAELTEGMEFTRKSVGDDHPLTLKMRFTLALAFRRLGETARAEREFRELVTSTERIVGPNSPELATALNTLGNIIQGLGEKQESEAFYKRALGIAERTYGDYSTLRASILNNLGVLYLESKRNDLAAEYFEKALEVRGRVSGVEHPEYSNLLQNLGIVYRNRREYAKSLEYYERALVIREKALGPAHPNIGYLLNNISNIQKVNGDFEAALATQRRVREIAEKSLGDFHELTLTSIGNTSNVYGAMGNLAKAAEFQRLWDARFERTLALNLSIGSERQKLAFTTRIEERTSRTVTLAKSGGQSTVDSAAEVILQRKGRVLDNVAGNLDAIRKRATPRDRDLLAKLSDVVGSLAKLVLSKPPAMSRDDYEKQIAALESQKETLEREISNEAAPLFVAPPVSLEKVRAAIPDDAALVEFAIYRPYDYKAENNDQAYGKPHYVAFVARKSGAVKFFDLGEREPIDRAVAEFRAALRNPDSKDVAVKSRIVRNLIATPIAESIRGSKKLIVAPDGELNLIPFEALADERGRYMIDDYSIVYVASGRDLLRGTPMIRELVGPFIVADPTFGAITGLVSASSERELSGENFVQLPGTAAEADTIRGLLPDAVVVTGVDATEERLKAVVRPSVLHVASHGFFFRTIREKVTDENPLIRAGLALAGANLKNPTGGDGILTALEASALDLRGTKLVVLSACDTGLGEVRAGEGVYGLRRAFSLAGAESLVMTLWPVGDFTSRRIISSYYKNLVAGDGRNEALRRTALEIKKKRESSHPYYWAAFIHWGNWQPLNEKR